MFAYWISPVGHRVAHHKRCAKRVRAITFIAPCADRKMFSGARDRWEPGRKAPAERRSAQQAAMAADMPKMVRTFGASGQGGDRKVRVNVHRYGNDPNRKAGQLSRPHSITSSASASIIGGPSRPSALAGQARGEAGRDQPLPHALMCVARSERTDFSVGTGLGASSIPTPTLCSPRKRLLHMRPIVPPPASFTYRSPVTPPTGAGAPSPVAKIDHFFESNTMQLFA